jgi:DmsE family decaheme c-type cytochrome
MGLAASQFAITIGIGLLLAGNSVEAENHDEPAYSAGGADTCLECHQSKEIRAVLETPHGGLGDPRVPFYQYQCETCHGPQGRHPAEGAASIARFAKDSPVGAAEQNRVCLDCHQSAVGIDWHGGTHEIEDLGCDDCHTVHAARDPLLSVANQPEVCLNCHLAQRAQIYKPYVHPIRQGKMKCSACHAPHGSPADHELRRPTLNETCYDCHAEKRGPFAFEHPPAAEDCSLCHAAHGSNHPALLIKRAPLLCQQCHSQSGHPSVSYTDAGLPNNTPSPFLLTGSCMNCHAEVHGSNHPSGITLMR